MLPYAAIVCVRGCTLLLYGLRLPTFQPILAVSYPKLAFETPFHLTIDTPTVFFRAKLNINLLFYPVFNVVACIPCLLYVPSLSLAGDKGAESCQRQGVLLVTGRRKDKSKESWSFVLHREPRCKE